MKMLEYETANPGADFDEHEYEAFDPEIHTSRPPTIVNIQPSKDPLEPHSAAEAHLDDGVKANPSSHTAGKRRHRRISAVKGGRKEPGESTEVYDAASSAEMGKGSQA